MAIFDVHAAEGFVEVVRLTVVPSAALALLLVLVGLLMGSRARRPVFVLAGAAVAVSLVAFAYYLPNSA